MVDLKKAPFFLTDAQIAWVEATQKAMTDDQKIEQLFCPLIRACFKTRKVCAKCQYGKLII